MELSKLVKVKKFFKKRIKNKVTRKKVLWIYLPQKLLATKKSRNARMGKGRGKFLRKVYKVRRNHIFMQFSRFFFSNLIKAERRFNKRRYWLLAFRIKKTYAHVLSRKFNPISEIVRV